ncbi:MAG: hypothetical protein IJU64_00610 [Bacilli bacterium]|nr:hypothetical protein [Bacilli bacterium]
MKRKLPFLLLLGIGMPSLTGCALFSNGAREDYFRVDLYGDYEGIDADISAKTPNASKARHLGYCWAKAGEAARLEGYSVLDNHRYSVSDRKAPNGYEYKFVDWKGFYANGNAIDVQSIQSDCALFTTFEAKPKDYLVTIQCAYETVAADYATFGTKIGDHEALKMTADTTNHDPRSYGYDPYYKDFSFTGYDVTVKNDDGTKSVSFVSGFTGINNITIHGETTITAHFDENPHSYTVTLNPIYEHEVAGVLTRDSLVGAPGIPDGAFDPRVIPYGASLGALPDLTALDYSFAYIEGNYASSAPSAVAGRKVDSQHILYDAAINVIYTDYVPEATVTFHLDPADPSKTETRTYHQSQDPAMNVFDYPTGKITVPADFAFTGRFYIGDELGDFVAFYDEANLFDQATLDLYPYFAPRKIVYADPDDLFNYKTKDYEKTFYYAFDADVGGYMLENFALQEHGVSPVVVLKDSDALVELEADDFWNEAKPDAFSFPDVTVAPSAKTRLLTEYDFTAVSSFHSFHSTEAEASSASKVNRFVLPSTVTQILPSGFGQMNKLCYDGVATLDLGTSSIRYLGEQTFREDLNIKKIVLPALESADSLCFYGCEYLTSIEIDLSEAAYEEAKANGDFHPDWNKKELAGPEIPLTFLG